MAPLRSSDRRKVVDQIIRDFEIEVAKDGPEHHEEQQSEEAAAQASSNLTSLRNSLLPEGAQSARFTTTVGAEAHKVSGTVYAAQFPNDEMRIYWLKIDDRLIPTGEKDMIAFIYLS